MLLLRKILYCWCILWINGCQQQQQPQPPSAPITTATIEEKIIEEKMEQKQDTVVPPPPVTPKPIERKKQEIIVTYKNRGKEYGKLRLLKYDHSKTLFLVDSSRKNTRTIKMRYPPSSFILETAVVDINNDKKEELFFILTDTTKHFYSLNIFFPFTNTILGFSYNALAKTPSVHKTKNWNSVSYKEEKEFLEKIKYHYEYESLREYKKIKFQEVQLDSNKQCFIQYKNRRGKIKSVLLQDESYGASLIKKKNNTLIIDTLQVYFLKGYSKIGTIDIDNDGNEEIFIHGVTSGSGYIIDILQIFYPVTNEIVDLSLSDSKHHAEIFLFVDRSSNFYDKKFKKARVFLEKLKYYYGYEDEKIGAIKNINNPNTWYAPYYWALWNDKINNGKMKIKKYKHNTPISIPIEELTIQDGDIFYTPAFKGGVTAYNKKTNEEYVIFYPHALHSWPIALKKYKQYLFIGTHGEGLAVVNTNNFHLRRYLFREYDSIDSLRFEGDKVILSNTDTIPMPKF